MLLHITTQIIIVIDKKINKNSQNHKFDGIKIFPLKNAVVAVIEIVRVIHTIIIKKEVETPTTPEIKQSKSSGKKGNKNISVISALSLPFKRDKPLFKLCSPMSHFTPFTPIFLPIKKAKTDAETMPTTL